MQGCLKKNEKKFALSFSFPFYKDEVVLLNNS